MDKALPSTEIKFSASFFETSAITFSQVTFQIVHNYMPNELSQRGKTPGCKKLTTFKLESKEMKQTILLTLKRLCLCMALTLMALSAIAQEIVCLGDSVLLQGFRKEIECPCDYGEPIGPTDCFPFTQPGGTWYANGEVVCSPCIDITVYPTENTVYTHETPGYICNPYIGPGPQPPWVSHPAGPTIIAEVIIDEDCGENPEPDCNNHSGTIFFDDCAGETYFFIQTPDGQILDPYYAEGIVFDHYEGQSINFDYIPATFPTPCSIADEAVTITCISEHSILIPEENIFEDYPWLLGLIDPIDCNVSGIFEYSFGSYAYVYVERENGGSLYLDDGTFYCSDGPGFSCLQAYNLDSATDEWICGDDDPVDPIDPPDPEDPYTIYDFIFEFNWLENVLDLEDCNFDQVTHYVSGNYSFIFVESDQADRLYFQDGTLYCTDAPGFSCVSAYNLEMQLFQATCPTNQEEGYSICPDESVSVSVPYQQGTVIGPPCPVGPTELPPPNCPCNTITSVTISPIAGVLSTDPFNGTFVLSPDVSTTYTVTAIVGPQHTEDFCLTESLTVSINVTVKEDCDEETEDPQLFNTYPWLSSLIDVNNCEGTSVNVYDQGPYAYIHIETATAGELYFETGAFYCADAPGFSCVSAYGLGTPTSSWTCGESQEEEEEEQTGDLSDYPWLEAQAAEWNCATDAPYQVTVYHSTFYDYIYIQPEEDGFGQLYFEDGTFYCGDAANFDCLALYGLTNVESELLWTCAGKSPEVAAQHNPLTAKLYPNPSQGTFTLDIEAQDSEQQQIMIYDLQGKLVEERQLFDTQSGGAYDFDLSHVDDGIYFVTVLTGYESTVQKLMIQR